nr:hypothetical protein [cf. Phormidesmis sp. LEGE 11477]
MQAVESLDYRVTVGDVATKAGLNVEVAQQGLLALASETQGHMQVSESGEIAYEFPRNFRGVLRNKYWQLRAQETLSKVWGALFYVIRISFGIMLMVSIALISIAIIVLVIAASSQGGDNNRDDRRGGGFIFFPTNFFYLFDFNYGRGRRRYPSRGVNRYGGGYSGSGARSSRSGEKLPFLEAIFSFLFGDGDPNENLEERRWQAIGSVIANNGGAIAAEQVTPYLDNLDEGSDQEYEDYMLPVLTRFNGQPEVSPTGEMVYYFPELQVSAMQRGKAAVSAYLKELKHKFTSATSDQVMISIGLGALNLVGALVLWNLLQTSTVDIEFIAFIQSIYWLLAGYGIAFLGIPLIRYYWMLGQNAKIEKRNEERALRASVLNRLGPAFQQKLAFAHQFAAQKVLNESDVVYSTETDLAEQGGDPDEADFLRRLNEI